MTDFLIRCSKRRDRVKVVSDLEAGGRSVALALGWLQKSHVLENSSLLALRRETLEKGFGKVGKNCVKLLFRPRLTFRGD